jgi:hypothetical protein
MRFSNAGDDIPFVITHRAAMIPDAQKILIGAR